MPNNTRGKFIVFEGLDGSGKGTQISLLSKFLNEKGIIIYERQNFPQYLFKWNQASA